MKKKKSLVELKNRCELAEERNRQTSIEINRDYVISRTERKQNKEKFRA